MSNGDDLLLELHKKTGHEGQQNIKRAFKNNMIKWGDKSNQEVYDQIKLAKLSPCIHCLKGRMKAEARIKESIGKIREPLEKVAAD